MKSYLLALVMFFLIFSQVHAQGWNWELTELDTRVSANDLLPNQFSSVLGIDEHSSPVFMRYHFQTGHFLLVDRDTSATETDWEEIPLPVNELPEYLKCSFNVDGAVLRANLTLSAIPRHLSMTLDYLNPEADWIVDPNSIVNFIIDENDNATCLFGDLNGDGQKDWLIVKLSSTSWSCSLKVAYRDVENDSGWNFHATTVPTVSGDEHMLLDVKLAQLDDDPELEVFLAFAGVLYFGQENYHFTYRFSLVDSFIPGEWDPRDVTMEGGYGYPLFPLDLDRDGVDECLVRRYGIWEQYNLIGSLFVETGFPVPPSKITMLSRDPSDPSILYCYSEYDYWTGGSVQDDRHLKHVDRWLWDEPTQRWNRVDRVVQSGSVDFYKRCRFTSETIAGSLRPVVEYQGSVLVGWTDYYPATGVRIGPASPGASDWVANTTYQGRSDDWSKTSYANLDNDPEFERLEIYRTSVNDSLRCIRTDLSDGEWVVTNEWMLPEASASIHTMAYLDQDTLPDILAYPVACFLNRPTANGISWLRQELFSEVTLPSNGYIAISDVDGDGDDDFIFPGGIVLMNTSTLSAPETTANDPLPSAFRLAPAYPNPFNPSTQITLDVPRTGHVRVEVMDILGRKVAVLHDGVNAPGLMRMPFDGTGLASGSYLVRASLDGKPTQARKIVLVK